MNVTTPAIPQVAPVVGVTPPPQEGLVVDVYIEGRRCIIHAAGELDRASSGQFIVTSTAGSHVEMVIDLDELTFMDSCGYEAIVECRRILEGDGRTLTIRGQTGEPARFLELIAKLDRIDGAQS